MAIAKSHLMEAFIVGRMVYTARQGMVQPIEITFVPSWDECLRSRDRFTTLFASKPYCYVRRS